MFDIGLGEILVLVLAALFVFGPDRLPNAAAQAGRMLRQFREMAQGAREEVTSALGPELGDLDLRDLDPRRAIQRALLDDDGASAGPRTGGANGTNGTNGTGGTGGPATSPPSPPRPEDPRPYDADAT